MRSKTFTIALLSLCLMGCASLIVEGEYIRTSSVVLSEKPGDYPIDIYISDDLLEKEYRIVGRVNSRAWKLEKGIDELKRQARKLGADGVIEVDYERKFSVDYLQDLYIINGKAVVWK